MGAVRGIGFSSATSEDVNFTSLAASLDQAEALAVDIVELPFMGMDLIAGGRVIAFQMKRLKAVLAGRKLAYTVHGPIGFNLFAPDELLARHVRTLEAYIEAAAEIAALHLIVHTGHCPSGRDADLDRLYGQQREALSRLGDAARNANLVLCVENIFVSNATDHTALPSRLASEIEAIGHPNVRACLDFSHAAITCSANKADFMTEAQSLARVSKHLHLHDSFGDPTQMRTHSRSERVAYGLGDLHLPLGWGNIDWDALMANCRFEDGVIFNLELPPPYRYALGDCVREVRRLAEVHLNKPVENEAEGNHPREHKNREAI
jgi:sugar phosphate isomerase/epimerase